MQKFKMEQIRFLEEKLATIRGQYEAKLEGIERWRIKMKAKHRVEHDLPLTPELLAGDQKLFEGVISKLGVNTRDKEGVSKSFAEYAKILKEREQNIQKLMAKAQNVKTHIEELMTARHGDEKKLFALEQESIKYKTNYGEICANEKTLEREKEKKKGKLELGWHKREQGKFREYLKKNDELLKDVKKNYGTKMADKLKMERRKELGELALVQQIDRQSEIKNLHTTLQRITSVLDSAEPFDTLSSQIKLVFQTNPLMMHSSQN